MGSRLSLSLGFPSGTGSLSPQRFKNGRKEVKEPHLLRVGGFITISTIIVILMLEHTKRSAVKSISEHQGPL